MRDTRRGTLLLGMISERAIRCPKCGKLLAKAENGATCTGVYVWCSRCKKNVEVKL